MFVTAPGRMEPGRAGTVDDCLVLAAGLQRPDGCHALVAVAAGRVVVNWRWPVGVADRDRFTALMDATGRPNQLTRTPSRENRRGRLSIFRSMTMPPPSSVSSAYLNGRWQLHHRHRQPDAWLIDAGLYPRTSIIAVSPVTLSSGVPRFHQHQRPVWYTPARPLLHALCASPRASIAPASGFSPSAAVRHRVVLRSSGRAR